MLKKLISYITLFCFFNSNCVLPIMASEHLLVDQTHKGAFVLNLGSLDMELTDLDLVDKETRELVGSLKVDNGNMILTGFDKYSFYLPDLPYLNSLNIKSVHSLIIGCLEARCSELDINESVTCTGKLNLGNGYLKTKKVTNNGELIYDTLKLEAVEFVNTQKGLINLGHAILDVTNSRNLGKIDVSGSLNVTGAWQNESKGCVTVGQHFNGDFTKYQDDGVTSVQGLASINADNGRITGTFLAHYGMIVFNRDLNIPTSATLSFQDHLTLHTRANLQLLGEINLQNRKDWPALQISKEIREKLRGLTRGVFISADKDFTDKGVLISDNSSIKLWAGGKYYGDRAIARSGFFEKNNFIISAATAILGNEIRTYNDLVLQAKVAELKGDRQVDKLLVVAAEELKQHHDDKNKVGSIVGQVENATLEGSLELAKDGEMTLRVRDTFKTEESFHLQGGKASIQVKHDAKMAGHFKDTALQVEAKKLMIAKNLNADVQNCILMADSIVHESGSKLVVDDLNKEVAKKSIRVEKNALIKAKNNTFKTIETRGWIFNSGSIESTNCYLADTCLHINMGVPLKRFMEVILQRNIDYATIKAKQAIVYADWFNLNFFADFSAKDVEINTLINLSSMSRLCGSDALKVNSLLGNFAGPGGIFQSNNYVSNSLVSWKTNCGINLFDPLNYRIGTDWNTWANRGLSAAILFLTGQALACVKGIQLARNIYGLLDASCKIWSIDDKDDKKNYWRLSRIAKRMGSYSEFAIQAYQTYGAVATLYVSEKPEPPSKNLKKLFTNMAVDIASGPVTQNAFFFIDQGYNFMPHIINRGCFYRDSSYNLALTKDVIAYSGKEYSRGYFYRNMTSVHANLIIGGEKNIATDNVVKAGGNIVVEEDYLSNAEDTNISAGGSILVKEGKHAMGENARFSSRGDMDYGGSTDLSGELFVLSEAKQNVGEAADDRSQKAVYQSKGDQTYKGKSVAKGEINISSIGDSVIVDKESVLVVEPSSNKKEEDCHQAPPKEKIIIQGNNGAALAGTVLGETSVSVLAPGGLASITGDARVHTTGILTIDGENALTGIGANLKVSRVHQHGGESSYFGGILTPTQGENSLVVSWGKMGEDGLLHGGEGGLLPGARVNGTIPIKESSSVNQPDKIVSEEPQLTETKNNLDYKGNDKSKHHNKGKHKSKNHNKGKHKRADKVSKTEERVKPMERIEDPVNYIQPKLVQAPETKQAPKQSVLLLGGPGTKAHLSGQIVVPYDVYANAGSVLLHNDLNARSGGIIAANGTDGEVIKEDGSILESDDVYLYGATGTIVDGVSTAENNFSATSDGYVTEKKNALTKAGGAVNFDAGTQYTCEVGAEASGKNVRRHGNSNDYAGKATASGMSSVTSGRGLLKIRSSSDNTAHSHVVGSGYITGEILPINKSGKVEFENGAKFEGEILHLRGLGIPDLVDLYQQTGRYNRLKITDYVKIETDQEVWFKKSSTSASNGFELDTNKITVGSAVKLNALTFLMLHSTVENMTLGYRAILGADVFLECTSAKDIVGDFRKELLRDKNKNVTGVKYKGVTFMGGLGVEYEYTDPETGEKSIRRMGLNVAADGKVKGTGMKFDTGSDIRVHGDKGVINKGAAQLYIKRIKEESNMWRDKTRIDYETEFFTPVIFAPGKVLLSSGNGDLQWDAGLFHAGDGADIIVSKDVKMLPLKGKRGHKTYRDTRITFMDSEDKTVEGLATTTTFINQGNSRVRIWAVDENGKRSNIIAPGLKYMGMKGTLQMKGHHGYFSRPILNNYSNSTLTSASVDYTILAHLKSLQVLQSAKNMIHHVAQEDWSMAMQDIVKPSMAASICRTSIRRNWQSLGNGGIHTNYIELDFTGNLYQRNSFSINSLGGGSIYVGGIWYQNGAKLKYSSESYNYGIFAGINANGPTAGVNFNHSKTKGFTWVLGQNNFGGTMDFKVNRLVQNAATMDVKHGTGSIGTIKSTTKQDERTTTGCGASIDLVQRNGTANVNHKRTRMASHTSGVNIDGGVVAIGRSGLTGAQVTGEGAVVEKVISRKLLKERDTGVSFGLGVSDQGVNTVSGGISNNGHELAVSLDVQGIQRPNDPEKLFNSIGGVSYRNSKRGGHISVPLIIGINPEAWQELRQDFKDMRGKISYGAPVPVARMISGSDKSKESIAGAEEGRSPLGFSFDTFDKDPSISKYASFKYEETKTDKPSKQKEEIEATTDPDYPTYQEDRETYTMLMSYLREKVDDILIMARDGYDKAYRNIEQNSKGVPEFTTDSDYPTWEETMQMYRRLCEPCPWLQATKELYKQRVVEPLEDLASYDKYYIYSIKQKGSGLLYGLHLMTNDNPDGEDTWVMLEAASARETYNNWPETPAELVYEVGKKFVRETINKRLESADLKLPSPSFSPAEYQ